MSREEAYHKILNSVSQFQLNISLILEAKAAEASRSSQWLCHHMSSSQFEQDGDQLRKTVEIHDQLIEVIDGMTKMEQALAKGLQALIGEKENSANDADNAGGLLGLDPMSFGGSLK
ncbi:MULTISPECIES: hypothetical protein [unclassified Paenibacillus]|uniref:hypothetical protein n=1 Tax=unclassified Paenibacillus TaxID=185978 RepID=UPI001AE989BC|nr:MULTISPECIES: hypothetical protein [unclassified Paenibacillus]MBP1156658.1 monoamine oxidase [Paenibacillus sp. PvP091]MBP1172604.1 monoamine oxidase [Paenibacillus sp. PvR098]MBP2438984.1 monoamine oxidase [Paenibacillus sp. PvP052]